MIKNEYAETRRLLDHLAWENNLLKSRLVEREQENANLHGQLGKLRGEEQIDLADAALEAFEQRMLNRNPRKKPLPSSKKVTIPSGGGDGTGNDNNNNPFLSRLGSKYIATRSLQPADEEPSGTTVHGKQQTSFSNKHPLKESNRRQRRRQASKQLEKDLLVQAKHYVTEFVLKLSLWDFPAYSVLILLFALIVSPALIHRVRHFGEWAPVSDRRLSGRRCVLNLFVDKHPLNEFDPDLKVKDVTVPMDGTHRTKGQIEVITRFIGSVADSFRMHLDVEQHLVFVGARDGGHLAQQALLHWPSRGEHPTQIHVFASEAKLSNNNNNNNKNESGLILPGSGDDPVSLLEKRFVNSGKNVHLYDVFGNTVAVPKDEKDDDDEFADDDDDALSMEQDPELEGFVNITLQDTDFDGLLWYNDTEVEPIIPYFHIDATSVTEQMGMLAKAQSLLENSLIAAVGLEHSDGLDVHAMLDFFNSVNYKTFMLGLRQLSRIDNLCPEVLDNIFDHPALHHSKYGSTTTTTTGWSLLSRLYNKSPKRRQPQQQKRTPPFFVAMPKGRHSKEEMTIQHMYDLFSGQGGGGQVKTANDRKAPGKK